MGKGLWALYGVMLAWGGATWMAGDKVESGVKAESERLKGRNFGFITVEKVDYKPGFLTSEAILHLAVRPDPCKPALPIKVHEKFRHDLVSGLGAVRSEVLLKFDSEEWNQSLEKAINGQPLFTISGRHSLDGTLRYEGASPAGSIKDTNSTLDWLGMTFTLERRGDDASAVLDFPGFSLESGSGNMTMKGLSYQATGRQTVIGLDTGDSRFAMKEMAFEPAAGTALARMPGFTLKDVSGGNRLSLSNGRADAAAEFRVASITMGKEDLSLETEVALNRMDTGALKALIAAARESGQTCRPDLRPVLAAVSSLFDGTAELQLKKMQVVMGDRRLALEGSLSGLNLSASQAVRGLQSLQAGSLFSDGRMRIKFRANEAFFQGEQPSAGPAAPWLTQLRARAEEGVVIRREGADYVTELTLEGSEIALNGIPWKEALGSLAPVTPDQSLPEPPADEEDVLAEWRRPGSNF